MRTPLNYEVSTRKRSKLMMNKSIKNSPAESSFAVEKAKALQASLDPRHPSFFKLMRRSHVTQAFIMRIPVKFCKMHLPTYDVIVRLEGDNGVRYETKFLAGEGALSGGWKRFSFSHDLREGDVVVFHLVKQCEFKAYTVRANHLDRPAEERQCEDSPAEIMDDQSSFGSFVDSKNFNVVFDGFLLDSELSFSTRVKYYELCYAQKSYLHKRLLKSTSLKLAAGIISETVRIVDAIKDCSISASTSSQTDIVEWNRTLEGFKLLGMDVEFLLDRSKGTFNLEGGTQH